MDFPIWGVLERESNHTPHANVASLEAVIVAAWDSLSGDFARKSCAAFGPHVQAVINAEGGHIEQSFLRMIRS